MYLVLASATLTSLVAALLFDCNNANKSHIPKYVLISLLLMVLILPSARMEAKDSPQMTESK